MDIVLSQYRAALAAVVWVGVVSGGLAKLLIYQSTPDAPGAYSHVWPANTRLRRDPQQPTLIMFAHPKCPCTMASLGELARIVAQSGNKLTVFILFLKPPESGADWDDTNATQKAQAIPGVQIMRDESGEETKTFGAVTSGQVLFYDVAGTLRFRGGITRARGHEGDNPGHSAIVSLVQTDRAALAETPVFGCSLLNPGVGRQR